MTQQMHFCVLHIALCMYGVRPAAVGVWLTATYFIRINHINNRKNKKLTQVSDLEFKPFEHTL